ncbi:MAG: ACT domain-containing protein [Bacteriovoracia bacterium]
METQSVDKFKHLKLRILSGEFKYVLFKDDAQLKEALPKLCSLALETEPFFLFRTSADRSAIVPAHVEVTAEKIQGSWIGIRIIGEMPFGTVQGLIATVTEALRKKGMGACVISTYLTDFFLIKKDNLTTAKATLEAEGWVFVE